MGKIPIVVQLVVMTLGLTGLYTMVGQMVPQKEVHPPEVIEIATDVSSDEMAAIGEEIFNGKGICNTCHTIGKSGALRFPDLAGIATTSATRIPGYTALDYLVESFYDPNVFIVEGFSPGMPVINKPPIGLTDEEILAVIAYMQTLGGTATVTMETKHAYNGGTLGGGDGGGDSGGDAGGDAEAVVADAAGDAGSGILATSGCTGCHMADAAGDTSKGPTVPDMQARLSRDQLVSGLIYHPGEDGLDQVTQDDIKALVTAISEMRNEG